MQRGKKKRKKPQPQYACLLTSLASSIQSRWWHFCLQPSDSSQGLITHDVRKELLDKRTQSNSRQMCCISAVVSALQVSCY